MVRGGVNIQDIEDTSNEYSLFVELLDVLCEASRYHTVTIN